MNFVRHSYIKVKDIHPLLSVMLLRIGALSKGIQAMPYAGSISYLYSIIIYLPLKNLAPLLRT